MRSLGKAAPSTTNLQKETIPQAQSKGYLVTPSLMW